MPLQGNKVKVNYAENLVSVQKSTVRVTESDDGRSVDTGSPLYAVSFNYDSLVPAVVRIFVAASDRTVPHQIRLVDLFSLALSCLAMCVLLCCPLLCCAVMCLPTAALYSP